MAWYNPLSWGKSNGEAPADNSAEQQKLAQERAAALRKLNGPGTREETYDGWPKTEAPDRYEKRYINWEAAQQKRDDAKKKEKGDRPR